MLIITSVLRAMWFFILSLIGRHISKLKSYNFISRVFPMVAIWSAFKYFSLKQAPIKIKNGGKGMINREI